VQQDLDRLARNAAIAFLAAGRAIDRGERDRLRARALRANDILREMQRREPVCCRCASTSARYTL